MADIRLILDPPASGRRNMAVDEVLLESAINDGIATIRVYAWAEPTVSLGYFQRAEEIAADPQFAGLAAVRRLSGGGAILHHHEITYSLAVPAAHSLTGEPSRLYRLAHDAIIQGVAKKAAVAPSDGRRLNGGEWALRMRGDDRSSIDHRPSSIVPFLCFGRGDPNDIVLGPHKIVGSAQRRRRGAVLQHGSLLLRRSPHAEEYPGLCDLTGKELSHDRLAEQLGRRIAEVLGGEWIHATLSAEERERAEWLANEKYATLDWKRDRESLPAT